MSKKLLISLAPLLAIVAIVATPTVAQATSPHWYIGGVVTEAGVKTPTLSWGTLTLTNSLKPSSPVSCENALGGYAEDPAGGGSGISVTNGWTAYNCKNEECTKNGGKLQVLMENESPTGLVAGEGLHWVSELNGTGSAIKLKSSNVKVYVSCQFAANAPTEKIVSAPLFERTTSEVEAEGTNCTTNAVEGGVQNPLTVNSNPHAGEPAKPSRLKFGTGGELYCTLLNPEKPTEEVKSKGATSGFLKTLDYEEQQSIQSFNP